MELLRQVDLGDRMQHFPGELSGGQEQRVAIARAMMNSPSLLLADEPTGNLDSVNHRMVLDLMQKLNRDGVTVIVASHNPEVAEIADRVVKLKDGKIEEVEVNMK
jgi:putative ABC transport system ATP-binding protein